MIAEALFAGALAFAGAGLLLPWRRGVGSSALVWLAFPTGAAAYLATSLVMVVVIGRLLPELAVLVIAGAGAGGLILARRRGVVEWSAMAASIGWVFLVAVVAWILPLTRLTIDSGEYLLGAVQIQTAGAADAMAPYLLKRHMGFQALHALSVSTARGHVAWVSPVFGVATVGLLCWLAWMRVAASHRWRVAVITGLVAFLVSSSRFFYDFFYIHPHIHMAAFLLVGVVGVWLAIVDDAPVWAMASGLALAATVLLRPEAPLLVAVVLMVVAGSPADVVTRRLVTLPVLVSTMLWYGLVLWRFAPDGSAIGLTEPVFSSILVIVGSAGATLLLDPARHGALTRWIGAAVVPGVAAVLAFYAVTDWIVLRDSVVATFRNLKRLGWWVTTWAVAVPLVAAAVLVSRVRLAEIWSRVVLGFGLLFFIFPHLRGSPWRIGPGDSGNRMLAHFLPVVLAFVILTFGGRDAEADTAG